MSSVERAQHSPRQIHKISISDQEGAYAGLPRYTSGDDDDLRTSESLLEAIAWGQESGDFGRGVDVREIGSDTRGVDDIEEPELSTDIGISAICTNAIGGDSEGAYLSDEGAGFEEKGQWLADST